MTARTIERRLGALEQVLKPVRYGPSFIMASSRAEANRKIERLEADYGDSLPKTLFVMIGPGADQ